MLRQMAVFVLITVMGSILWGCQTTEDIGIQKISYLKSSTLRTYGNYHNTLMRHEDKSPTGVFAYDPITNRSGYSVSWGGNDAYSAAKRRAREACEKGNSCQIFDIDGRVVWKNISPEITRKLAAIANKRSNATPSQKVVEYKSWG